MIDYYDVDLIFEHIFDYLNQVCQLVILKNSQLWLWQEQLHCEILNILYLSKKGELRQLIFYENSKSQANTVFIF